MYSASFIYPSHKLQNHTTGQLVFTGNKTFNGSQNAHKLRRYTINFTHFEENKSFDRVPFKRDKRLIKVNYHNVPASLLEMLRISIVRRCFEYQSRRNELGLGKVGSGTAERIARPRKLGIGAQLGLFGASNGQLLFMVDKGCYT